MQKTSFFEVNTFEELLAEQASQLLATPVENTSSVLQQAAEQALEWFDIDRLTLFPVEFLDTQDMVVLTAHRHGIPAMASYLLPSAGRVFLDELKVSLPAMEFSAQTLRYSNNKLLSGLYEQGVRWHGVIPVTIHGRMWGGLSFSRFGEQALPLQRDRWIRLRFLSEIWAGNMEFARMARLVGVPSRRIDECAGLTMRQREVISLLASGHTAKQCADKLNLSPRTVETYKYRIMQQLGLEHSSELLQFAIRNGLVSR